MKIYTKTGDAGSTALYGGERVAKDATRVAAYGTVDEANAAIGLARAHLQDTQIDQDLAGVQSALFELGADLATPQDSRYRRNLTPIADTDVSGLEALIDSYSEELEPLQNFILPGGRPASAALQLARAVTRRAEREAVALGKHEPINPQVLAYLNRLSDLLFVLARIVNARAGVSEARWHVQSRHQAG
ncbi:MAG TPA: cob(I)yrinic acid a,c-diamide adenosyltransferase [Trueperaceae bacterium]